MAEAAARPVGPDRLLAAGYALFVVAAGARSAVQLATDPARAPLAYGLSAAAALGYAVGLVLFVRAARGHRRGVASAWCVAELLAVLAVGTWTLVRPSAFPDATVWSYFGAGYLFAPIALPALALAWLRPQPLVTRSGRFRGRIRDHFR